MIIRKDSSITVSGVMESHKGNFHNKSNSDFCLSTVVIKIGKIIMHDKIIAALEIKYFRILPKD